jgi:hypothetical protein
MAMRIGLFNHHREYKKPPVRLRSRLETDPSRMRCAMPGA